MASSSSSYGVDSSAGDGSSSGGAGGMSAEDQMRDEIARLTATINQHKSAQTSGFSNPPSYGSHTSYGGYGNGYYGGGYAAGGGYRGRGRGRGGGAIASAGPHKQYVRPGLVTPITAASAKGKENAENAFVPGNGAGTEQSGEGQKTTKGKKEVIIGGVAFEASKRSLVRKDLVVEKPKSKKAIPHLGSAPPFARNGPQQRHLVPPRTRTYKPKGRNMTLDNTGRTYTQSKKAAVRKIEKPCSRFTKTGTCSRGLTCPYQHDPTKIALCWKFMQGDCLNTADTCNLSHNPVPERTPLCVHFLNRGRCTKEKCLFPHVNVGKKEGVCKDFAVLGYCEKGLGCDRNHVRECPEFEETGECRTKGCKLPHVIKANARWAKKDKVTEEGRKMDGSGSGETVLTAESGKLGDEYISLIFNESDESDSDDEELENDEDEDEDNDDDGEENQIEMEVHG